MMIGEKPPYAAVQLMIVMITSRDRVALQTHHATSYLQVLRKLAIPTEMNCAAALRRLAVPAKVGSILLEKAETSPDHSNLDFAITISKPSILHNKTCWYDQRLFSYLDTADCLYPARIVANQPLRAKVADPSPFVDNKYPIIVSTRFPTPKNPF